jgi:hypothetical protein
MNARTERSIEEFFESLVATPLPPLGFEGTLRFDIDDDGTVGQWFLHIGQGQVSVSRRRTAADAVVAADQDLFARIMTGEANALTAGLRGQLRMEGDLRLAVAFARLQPGPPGRRTTLPPPGRGAKRAVPAAKATGTVARSTRTSKAAAAKTRKERPR